MEFTANDGKSIDITTSRGVFSRGPIKTHFVAIGENYVDLVKRYVSPLYEEGDLLSISEKIISLCQNRVVYKRDMHITRLAKFLSGFASHSDAGIGVDSVYKMQFAIDHCGKAKILWAAFCSGVGKVFGKHGIFYDIAGMEVTGLDGFYDAVFDTYGEFGIRLPSNPSAVCDEIYNKTGVMATIVDANDFTRTILGKGSTVRYTEAEIAEMIRDNPSGQSDELTPFVLIRKKQ